MTKTPIKKYVVSNSFKLLFHIYSIGDSFYLTPDMDIPFQVKKSNSNMILSEEEFLMMNIIK